MTQAWTDEGRTLPEFSLELASGGHVHLADLLGRPAVLFFYPKDDTPGCTTEAKDFSALMPRFDAGGITVLGISKDAPEKHRRFIARHGLTVPLASDLADPGLSDRLGIWGRKSLYGKIFTGMIRSTLLLDRDGRIARVWRKVRVKGHAAEVLDAALALARPRP